MQPTNVSLSLGISGETGGLGDSSCVTFRTQLLQSSLCVCLQLQFRIALGV